MEGADALLRFSHVYIHQTEGKPGIDPGSGWSQEAVIRISNGVISGSLTEWPSDLGGGYLKMDGAVSRNMIPIPLDHEGQIELRVEGWGAISITGTHIRLELIGQAEYVEEFPGCG